MTTSESAREHVANALQMLRLARPLYPTGRALTHDEYDAIESRLEAALTLLDQQESK